MEDKTSTVEIKLNGESRAESIEIKETPQYGQPEEQEAELKDLVPLAPDGGWGWIVVMASFFIHFILDGICYAFGAILPAYAAQFDSSDAQTAALMSTVIGCYLLSAPIASALVNKFGCRLVGMVGSIIAASGFILSTFSTSINSMIFTLGVITGVGFGLLYLPAVVCVSLYFEKKRPLATGIAMCGSGVGVFVFGPLQEWLLDQMDWKGVHFVLAGFVLQCVVLNALVRPIKTKQEKMMAAKITTENKEPSAGSRRRASVQNTFGSVRVVKSTSHLSPPGVDKPEVILLNQEQTNDLKRPMYKQDIFYSGSVYHLREFQSAHNITDFNTSMITIPSLHEEPVRRFSLLSCKCLPKNMSNVISEMLDLNLFKTPAFTIIFFSVLALMLAYFIPFVYCTPRAVANGVSDEKATFLISILGISTMVGRLSAGFIATIPKMRSITLHNSFLFVAGLSALFIPVCQTYVTMAVAAFFYGTGLGGHVMLSPIVLVDSLGLMKLTSSFGLMTLARGISTIAGPPIAGSLNDTTHSHDMSFYFAGGVIMFSTLGFCLLDIPCIRKTSNPTLDSTPSEN